MIWWDWNWRHKLALLGAMVGAASAAVLWFGHGWPIGAEIGGISFLIIPQINAWLLFVGLLTGAIPQRGRRVSRAVHPIEFWITAACYGAVLAGFAWFAIIVAFST
jgi:hypothetical protein